MQETVGNSWTVLKVILSHKYHHLLGFYLSQWKVIRPSDQWNHCRSWRRDTNAEKQTLERRLLDPCVTAESVVTAAAPQSCVCTVCVSVWRGKGGRGGGGQARGGGIRYVCGGWGGVGGDGCGCGVRGKQQYYDYGPHWTKQSERWLWPETLGLPVVLSDGRVQGGKANIGKPGYVNTVNIEKNKQTTTTTQQRTNKKPPTTTSNSSSCTSLSQTSKSKNLKCINLLLIQMPPHCWTKWLNLKRLQPDIMFVTETLSKTQQNEDCDCDSYGRGVTVFFRNSLHARRTRPWTF